MKKIRVIDNLIELTISLKDCVGHEELKFLPFEVKNYKIFLDIQILNNILLINTIDYETLNVFEVEYEKELDYQDIKNLFQILEKKENIYLKDVEQKLKEIEDKYLLKNININELTKIYPVRLAKTENEYRNPKKMMKKN